MHDGGVGFLLTCALQGDEFEISYALIINAVKHSSKFSRAGVIYFCFTLYTNKLITIHSFMGILSNKFVYVVRSLKYFLS